MDQIGPERVYTVGSKAVKTAQPLTRVRGAPRKGVIGGAPIASGATREERLTNAT